MKKKNVMRILFMIIGILLGISYFKSSINPHNTDKEFDMFNALVIYPEITLGSKIESRVKLVKEFKGYCLVMDTEGKKFSIFCYVFNNDIGRCKQNINQFIEKNDSIYREVNSDTLYLYKNDGSILNFKMIFD